MGSPAMAEIQWWYARDDQQLGPDSPGDLRRLAGVGGLAPTDLVRARGESEWAAGRIKGLFPEIREGADEAAGGAGRGSAASPNGCPARRRRIRRHSLPTRCRRSIQPRQCLLFAMRGRRRLNFRRRDAGSSPGRAANRLGPARAAGLMDVPEVAPARAAVTAVAAPRTALTHSASFDVGARRAMG